MSAIFRFRRSGYYRTDLIILRRDTFTGAAGSCRTKAVMAGSLEPTDCNDTGPHGYWMGTFGAAGADVYFIPLRHCEYCHEMYQADRNTTDRMLWDWAKELLEQRPEYQYFRLYIKGKKIRSMPLMMQEIGKLDRIVDITDQTVPDYDYEKLLEEHADSILGEYIRSMQKKRTGASAPAKALEYGVMRCSAMTADGMPEV